jgi:MFS family permease
MMFGLVGTSGILLAQGSAPDVSTLAAATVVGGLAFGVVRPLANVMIADIVPVDDRGKAFGITTSASAFGFAIGPIVGAYLGATFGFPAAFYITSALFLAVTGWVWRSLDTSTPTERAKAGL